MRHWIGRLRDGTLLTPLPDAVRSERERRYQAQALEATLRDSDMKHFEDLYQARDTSLTADPLGLVAHTLRQLLVVRL